ncbi:MAG: hypothetical protein JST26_18855 [Bacteroidetes bacterium]|nr:hypothetical protein [Bacteroidota bacterium]
MKFRFLIIFCFVFALKSLAQLSDTELSYFSKLEDSLKILQKKVFYSKKESDRFEANKQFLAIWNEIIPNEKSFQYPFDSLTEISRLTAPDKSFRIVTWNVFKNDGTQAYFGFIQSNQATVKKSGLFKKTTLHEYHYFLLSDKSSSVKTPENYVSDHTKWFGMLYYDIIKSDDYYILLGWDGNDKITQRKFIDVLTFKDDGTPTFGKDVFKYPGKFAKRVMFEYASEVSMSLKYHPNRKQIVFNHLAPKDPDAALEGQYQYYGPDGSFDALTEKKGRWVYEGDIDIRKAKDKTDNVNKPDPDKQKPVYKPN